MPLSPQQTQPSLQQQLRPTHCPAAVTHSGKQHANHPTTITTITTITTTEGGDPNTPVITTLPPPPKQKEEEAHSNSFPRPFGMGRIKFPKRSSSSTTASSFVVVVDTFLSKGIVSPLHQMGCKVITTATEVFHEVVPPVVHDVFHSNWVIGTTTTSSNVQTQHHHHHYSIPTEHHHLRQQQRRRRCKHQKDVVAAAAAAAETTENIHHHPGTAFTSKYHVSSNDDATWTTTTRRPPSPTPPPNNNIRLLNSSRLIAMRDREDSFYRRSVVLPVFHFLGVLLYQWWGLVRRTWYETPVSWWPLVLLLTWYQPLIPILVVPTWTMVLHYGKQYYSHLVLPTPKQVEEMFERIQSIVHHWWIRFVGRYTTTTTTNDHDRVEHQRNVRTRKRTAIAVSLVGNHVLKQSRTKPLSKSI